MPIRLNKTDKTEFYRLFVEAVKLQVQLFDKLGEIEGVTGMLGGLDSLVTGEASNFDTVESVEIGNVNEILSQLDREA